MKLVFIIYKQYNWIDDILFMILDTFEQFMAGILQHIDALGIDVTGLNLDHMITLKLTDTTQVKFHLTPVLDIIKGKTL